MPPLTGAPAVELAKDVEPRPNTGGATLHSIQCLRAIAATIVVVFHAHITFASQYSPAFSANESYLFGFGKVGVHVFFVISGYIMYLSSFGSSIRFKAGRFFVRRILRIYPVYWIFVAVYLLVTKALGVSPKLSVSQFWGMLSLLPASAPLVIGPAWTLSYEVYFYIVFGIVMLLGPTRGIIMLTTLFIGCVIIGAVCRPDDPTLAMATNGLLLEFVMGVWIGRVTILHALPKEAGWLALAGAFIGYATGLVWGYDRLPSAIVWGLPSALLVAGVIILEQRKSLGLSHPARRMSWLGDSSYSLYLCHILIITLILFVLRTKVYNIDLISLVSITTAISILFAIAFHKMLERPLMRRLHEGFLARKVLAPKSYQPCDQIPDMALFNCEGGCDNSEDVVGKH
jgi:exopolysaccharide production protein ExoZ